MSKLTHFTAVLLAGAAPAAFVVAPASAQEAETQIVVEAEPMADALRDIGEQSGVEIRFNENAMTGIVSNPVRAGDAATAIRQAIAGRNLELTGSPASGYLVGRPARSAADEEIIVRARVDEAEENYLVTNANSSTRDGRSLRDQPQATTVISGKLIEDQQAQTVAEALRNAAGATVNLGNVQGQPSFTVRGFDTQPLSGGLVDPGALSQSTINIERIEVLKGPAALLAGADNFGGTVNVVQKRPSADPILDLIAEYGSFDDVRLAFDGSTALDPDRRFSARLVAQYARADRTFGDFEGRFDNLIAPSLRYKDRDFDLVVGASFNDQFQPIAPFGAVNRDGELVNLTDINRGPDEQGFRNENRRAYYDANWSPTDWLTLVSRSQISNTDSLIRNFALAQLANGFGPFPDFDVVFRSNIRQEQSVFATDNYARLDFDVGPVSLSLTGGVNYSDRETESFRDNGRPAVLFGDFIDGSFNFFTSPTRSTPVDPSFGTPSDPDFNTAAEQTGYFGQAFVEYGPLSLIGGVRQNEFTSITTILPNGTPSIFTADALTPNFGAVFDISDDFSIYGNYIEGFRPNFLLDRNAEQLPPETSTNIEGGFKWDISRDRLQLIVSGYRLQQENIQIVDVGAPPPPGQRVAYTVIEGQESKGVEVELTGVIVPGWQVAASYSYAEYELLETRGNIQNIAGQPSHRYSLFSRYDIQDGVLEGLGLGAYFFGFSESLLNTTENPAVLDGQQQLDLNLYYSFGDIRANLGVTNVLDEEVYGVSRAPTFVPLNPGRTFRLTLTYSLF